MHACTHICNIQYTVVHVHTLEISAYILWHAHIVYGELLEALSVCASETIANSFDTVNVFVYLLASKCIHTYCTYIHTYVHVCMHIYYICGVLYGM